MKAPTHTNNKIPPSLENAATSIGWQCAIPNNFGSSKKLRGNESKSGAVRGKIAFLLCKYRFVPYQHIEKGLLFVFPIFERIKLQKQQQKGKNLCTSINCSVFIELCCVIVVIRVNIILKYKYHKTLLGI